MSSHLIHSELSGSVIGAFFEVNRELGYGFLEHVYQLAMERELRRRGHAVEREALITAWYKGEKLTRQRIDLLVDDKLIVELKSTSKLDANAPRQLLNYLRASESN